MDIPVSKHLAIMKELNEQNIVLQRVIKRQNKSIEKLQEQMIKNNKKKVKILQ